jgi:hypothetical protein
MTHYDFLAKVEETTSLPPGPTGLQPLPDMLVRLSRLHLSDIPTIRQLKQECLNTTALLARYADGSEFLFDIPHCSPGWFLFHPEWSIHSPA